MQKTIQYQHFFAQFHLHWKKEVFNPLQQAQKKDKVAYTWSSIYLKMRGISVSGKKWRRERRLHISAKLQDDNYPRANASIAAPSSLESKREKPNRTTDTLNTNDFLSHWDTSTTPKEISMQNHVPEPFKHLSKGKNWTREKKTNSSSSTSSSLLCSSSSPGSSPLKRPTNCIWNSHIYNHSFSKMYRAHKNFKQSNKKKALIADSFNSPEKLWMNQIQSPKPRKQSKVKHIKRLQETKHFGHSNWEFIILHRWSTNDRTTVVLMNITPPFTDDVRQGKRERKIWTRLMMCKDPMRWNYSTLYIKYKINRVKKIRPIKAVHHLIQYIKLTLTTAQPVS